MKKFLLLTPVLLFVTILGFSQSDRFWSANNESRGNIPTDKAVARLSYPKEFKLFNLETPSFRRELFTIAGANPLKHSTVISLPNAGGSLEEFEVVEASNFEPGLQAQFPEIRAYSGKGVTDKYATLKLSISPQGIETMVFRTGSESEFIEPYSKDHSVYAVYQSHRDKGKLPWTCTTEEKQLAADIDLKIERAQASGSSAGQLKTMRLAQSCNAEYANFFGATSPSQVGLVIAAFNTTITRCNGCYERDLALHLNLVANTASLIYYNPSTDPYTTLSNWNLQLQQTLTSVIGSANYDIGHMFGASGGGGNAGCIGCVCSDPPNSSALAKGSGITSPADGVPKGDNFDIDYVVHEVGHQLGANHTFSMSLEGTGVNKEVGSGITIMGYAGITSQDVAPHSIDIYHETSIAQIQANLAGKSCPATTNIATNNAAPVISVVSSYTIPISTPFALTASASDANGDALTYCWEQNDNATSSGANSVASPSKATGPNWLSFRPAVSPTRTFPQLSTILAGLLVTPPLPGGDGGANIEALSSVSRALNFRLTVRDNHAYSSAAPVAVGQTAFADVVVNVTNSSGPFKVTAPNTNVTWSAGSPATITWNVNNTNLAPVSCTSVNILLSSDNGNTFTPLVSGTANDGTETVMLPSTSGTANRIKVEAVGNIFFDISDVSFTIGTPAPCATPAGLAASEITQSSAKVSWSAVSNAVSYAIDYKAASSGTWVTAATAVAGTSVDLTGLAGNTLYDWRVRATCTAGAGSDVQAQFTTSAAPVTCPGPFDVSTNGTTEGAALIALNTNVNGSLNVSGDNDYYRFSISNGGTITMSLAALPANYDLALLNVSGTLLQSSTNNSTNNESIGRTVTPGTYYARVYPRNNGAFSASACYTLRVQTGTASRSIEDVQYVSAKLLVSPNPAAYTVNVGFNAEAHGNATISVINQTGSSVLSKTVAVVSGNNVTMLDVSHLANGVYFMKVQTGAVMQMTKLVVAK